MPDMRTSSSGSIGTSSSVTVGSGAFFSTFLVTGVGSTTVAFGAHEGTVAIIPAVSHALHHPLFFVVAMLEALHFGDSTTPKVG